MFYTTMVACFFFFETYCYFIILFGGIDMAFMKFVIKTLVVAKHNLLAGLFACALLLFFQNHRVGGKCWVRLGMREILQIPQP